MTLKLLEKRGHQEISSVSSDVVSSQLGAAKSDETTVAMTKTSERQLQV